MTVKFISAYLNTTAFYFQVSDMSLQERINKGYPFILFWSLLKFWKINRQEEKEN